MIKHKKRKNSRLGKVIVVETKVTIEDAIRQRRERVIDLSQYNVGFDAVKNHDKARPKTSSNNSKGTQYEKFLYKFETGQLDKFSSRDFMFFFRDVANANGVKYIIGNPKVEMRQFKLALDRGYTKEELLVMIEFLFTSGQKYLDPKTIHPGILLTNWCNKIYQDSQLWLEDKYDPNATFNKPKVVREWTDTSEESKSNVGEWE